MSTDSAVGSASLAGAAAPVPGPPHWEELLLAAPLSTDWSRVDGAAVLEEEEVCKIRSVEEEDEDDPEPYSQQGSIKWPDGACIIAKVSVPGLKSMRESPGPVKLICILVRSIMARRSINVFSPRSAGRALSSTVGALYNPTKARSSTVLRAVSYTHLTLPTTPYV